MCAKIVSHNFMKKIFSTIFIGLLISSCTFSQENRDTQKIQVSASFYPIYFIAKSIGGDQARVVNITPIGVEPHEYEPSIQSKKNIFESQLFLINGIMEPWGEKLIPEIKKRNVTVIKLIDNIPKIEAGKNNHSEDHNQEYSYDPHIWLSPKTVLIMIDSVLAGFKISDPNNTPYYESNTEKLKNEIQKLDIQFQEKLATCRLRDIVTSHAAFGYLARDYGLRQIPIAGLSPEMEPSAIDIAHIVKIVREKSIPVIFTEKLISPRFAETITRETGTRTLTLNALE